MFESVKGTKDILPEEIIKWRFLEEKILEICDTYNYKEIRIPTFEHSDLFNKSTGEETEVVQKQMYTFIDKGGRSLTLKPEGTPSIVRSFLQYSLYKKSMTNKLFYIERTFRQERPQKGRFREFNQFGIENIGSPSFYVDIEVISLGMNFLKSIGISNAYIRLNSLGCEEDRKRYKEELKRFLIERRNILCDDCKDKIEKNPLRVLDCKKDHNNLSEAPDISKYLCDDCLKHFEGVKNLIQELKLKFVIDPQLVRGLDYYTKTVFEFISPCLGAQDALGGGGRYDNLIKNMGGPDLPACGFAMGMERIIMHIDENISLKKGIDFYIITLGDIAQKRGFLLMEGLRRENFKVDKDFHKRSIKAQMREAEKLKSNYVIIIGDNEIEKGKLTIKEMKTGEQFETLFDVEEIKGKIYDKKC